MNCPVKWVMIFLYGILVQFVYFILHKKFYLFYTVFSATNLEGPGTGQFAPCFENNWNHEKFKIIIMFVEYLVVIIHGTP